MARSLFIAILATGYVANAESPGKQFYFQTSNRSGEAMSCSTCHGEDPRKPGRTRAQKEIEPMAPSVNPKRFTDPAKVEKWFRRNCKDVLDRECTMNEKNDFIAYLKSLK